MLDTRYQSRFIRVSSEDKNISRSTNNSRFSVDLPSTGQVIDRVSLCELKYASCPNVFPNVPETKNVITVIKETGAVSFVVSIPADQYTSSELIADLKTAINLAIPDTVDISLQTVAGSRNKLLFTFVGDNYAIDYTGSSIADIIGLTTDTASALMVSMQSQINLTGESEVYIHSRVINRSGLTESTGNFSVIGVIPLQTVPYGAVAYTQEPSAQLSRITYEPFTSKKSFREVDIVLRDRLGNALILPDNFYFTVLLKVYYNLSS